MPVTDSLTPSFYNGVFIPYYFGVSVLSALFFSEGRFSH